MGVMACDREGCDNIMCSLCPEGRWYVCDDCADEFEGLMVNNGAKTKGQIVEHFSEFMSTRKQCSHSNSSVIVREFLGRD